MGLGHFLGQATYLNQFVWMRKSCSIYSCINMALNVFNTQPEVADLKINDVLTSDRDA